MKLWSDFYPYITVYLPGCAYPVIDEQLRQSAIDFCERTGVWREWLDPVKTVASTKQYDFDILPTQEIVQVVQATLDGEPLSIVSSDDLKADWQSNEPSRQGLTTYDRRSFYLLQTPSAAGLDIVTNVSIKPSLTATGISDELFAHYARPIAFGAASELMLIPGQTFANPSLSENFRERFNAAVARTAIDKFRADGRTARRSRASFF